MRGRVSVVCGVLVVLLASMPAVADDAVALFKKMDEQMYYPQNNGLKDVSARLESSAFKMNPMMAAAKVRLYWKAPDQKAVDVEGLEGPMAGMAGQIEAQMGKMVDLLVPECMSKKFEVENYDLAVGEDEGQTTISGTLKAGKGGADDPDEFTFWLNDKDLPERTEMTMQGQSVEQEDITYEKKGHKYVMTGTTIVTPHPMGEGTLEQVISFSFTEVSGVWLVSSMKSTNPMMEVVMEFKDVKVNGGLDDSLFEDGGGSHPQDDDDDDDLTDD